MADHAAEPVDYLAGDPRSNHERMVAGDLYIADDPAILAEQARAARLMARFRAAYDEDPGAAQAVARELFGAPGRAAAPPGQAGGRPPDHHRRQRVARRGVIVCPGVTIGDNSVVGAGAVVTRDVPPNSLAVGNPARVVRTI